MITTTLMVGSVAYSMNRMGYFFYLSYKASCAFIGVTASLVNDNIRQVKKI